MISFFCLFYFLEIVGRFFPIVWNKKKPSVPINLSLCFLALAGEKFQDGLPLKSFELLIFQTEALFSILWLNSSEPMAIIIYHHFPISSIGGEEKVFIGYKNTKPLHLPHSFSHNIAYQCSRKIETGFLVQVSHRFRHGSPCFKNTDRNGIISHSISTGKYE